MAEELRAISVQCSKKGVDIVLDVDGTTNIVPLSDSSVESLRYWFMARAPDKPGGVSSVGPSPSTITLAAQLKYLSDTLGFNFQDKTAEGLAALVSAVKN